MANQKEKVVTEKDFEKAIKDSGNADDAMRLVFIESSASACYQLAQKLAEECSKDFAEWISNNQFKRYDDIWTSTKVYYSGERKTTSELFTLYLSQLKNKG